MSNNKLRQARFSINELVKLTQGHSYASQSDMRHRLTRCVKDLYVLGFKISHVKGLQTKHITALIVHWQAQGKNPATIKNYLATLRKTAALLNKPHLVKPTNDAYQLEPRAYQPRYNKAIHQLDWSACPDPYIRLSLEGQALFGLRREESMKFVLSEAHHGHSITLKPSWTKGGIGRTIMIQHDTQRQWLTKVAKLVSTGESLIPQERTYQQHLSRYQQVTQAMGVSKLHGLRHAYAQRRYYELTQLFDPQDQGLISPMAGGKLTSELTDEEKRIDRKAREIISRELGHSRLSITKIYLG